MWEPGFDSQSVTHSGCECELLTSIITGNITIKPHNEVILTLSQCSMLNQIRNKYPTQQPHHSSADIVLEKIQWGLLLLLGILLTPQFQLFWQTAYIPHYRNPVANHIRCYLFRLIIMLIAAGGGRDLKAKDPVLHHIPHRKLSFQPACDDLVASISSPSVCNQPRKIPWNTPPWPGIEPGSRREQTVRNIHSISHWAIMIRITGRTNSEIHSFSHGGIMTQVIERTDTEIHSFSHWAIMTQAIERTDTEIHSFSYWAIMTQAIERTDTEIHSFSYWALMTQAIERTDTEIHSFSHWALMTQAIERTDTEIHSFSHW